MSPQKNEKKQSHDEDREKSTYLHENCFNIHKNVVKRSK